MARGSGSLLLAIAILTSLENQCWGLVPPRLVAERISQPRCQRKNSISVCVKKDKHEALTDDLVASLDLDYLVSSVANHCGTHRGRQAILALIGKGDDDNQYQRDHQKHKPLSKRRQIIHSTVHLDGVCSSANERGRVEWDSRSTKLFSVAASSSEAQEAYKATEQAMLALKEENGLRHPPLYGSDSSPWDISAVHTDYDEWLSFPVDEWTLEYVLQADRIVDAMLQVRHWSEEMPTRTHGPALSEIGRKISRDRLLPLHRVIEGAVVVTRGSLDPMRSRSYAFRLNSEKFPELEVLYEKERELVEKIDRAVATESRKLKGSNEVLDFQGRKVLSVPKSVVEADLGIVRGFSGGRCYVEPRTIVSMGDELSSTRQKLDEIRDNIQQRLIASILEVSSSIDTGMHQMAHLDVIFAKAAWGVNLKAVIPYVGRKGIIEVHEFLHPLLVTSSRGGSVVPIDLHLRGVRGYRALVISGPNGGGKSVALKSFGLVCVLCKLGLPIPSSKTKKPRVDFVDNIIVEFGDKQNVMKDESTMTARLKAYASVINEFSDMEKFGSESSLILMDELGGGTDPNAGSAISQAILEKLLESSKCAVVATTHAPELKALSLESSQFDCATVLLKKIVSNEDSLLIPTYRLEYGLTGDSHALAAAYRCTPKLPDDVLSRAADLLSSNNILGSDQQFREDRMTDLSRSIDLQEQAAFETRLSAEKVLSDAKKCQRAILRLAEAYDRQFTLLESRLEATFQKLQSENGKESVDIVGDTLAELRLVKKKVKSDEDLLRERGLKIAPESYEFKDGESVVIVAKGEYEGEMAQVVLSDSSSGRNREVASNELVVRPSFGSDRTDLNESETSIPSLFLIFKRFEIAIWDYESVWDNDNNRYVVSSVRESRRKLFGVLSSLSPNSDTENSRSPKKKPPGSESKFTSARQRKAANAAMKKEKKKRRK